MTFRHEPVFEVWCQERGQGQGYQESETDPVGSAAHELENLFGSYHVGPPAGSLGWSDPGIGTQ
jgi:hypothetical protein